ncbi:MAG: hypothetical protein F6K28_37890 [Microcoleus sp. SIO2G3]|nr:hypothetical protein [Microcoleus sp. SIO2G3]
MSKHYVLSLDPSAEYEWDRCVLRDPITAERPDLARLVAESLPDVPPGAYLLSINVEVTVLETAGLPPSPVVVASARQEELVA